MIKSLLVAAAVAVLSLSGGGVALASSVAPSTDASVCIRLRIDLDKAVTDAQKVAAQTALDAANCGSNNLPNPSNGNHPPRGGADCPGDLYPNLNGCQRNDGNRGGTYHGPAYRDCNDARSHGYRDVRRGDSRYNDSWDRNRDGVACDDGDIVVVDSSGDCTTYAVARDSIRTYSNDYNRLRNQYHGDWNRVSSSDRNRLNQYYSASRRYSSSYDSTRLSNLRTICKDTSPTVTIVNEAPPAPVVVQAPASNPVPYGSSGGQVSSKPSGGAETGDGSTLIH
jgi:hypothetical protein